MSHPVVSQDEIDALLHGFVSERADFGVPARESGVAAWATANRLQALAGSAMPGLDAIHHDFAAFLSDRLSDLAGQATKVVAARVSKQPVERLLAAFAGPVRVHCLSVDREIGPCLLVLQSNWIRRYVDLQFGGGGNVESIGPVVELSPTERQTEGRLRRLLCQEYMRAWRATCPLQLTWRRSENSTSFVTRTACGAPMVVGALRIQIGEFAATAWIAFPERTLEHLARQVGVAVMEGPAIAAAQRSWRHGAGRPGPGPGQAVPAPVSEPRRGESVVMRAGALIELRPGDMVHRAGAAPLQVGPPDAPDAPRALSVMRPQWAPGAR